MAAIKHHMLLKKDILLLTAVPKVKNEHMTYEHEMSQQPLDVVLWWWNRCQYPVRRRDCLGRLGFRILLKDTLTQCPEQQGHNQEPFDVVLSNLTLIFLDCCYQPVR